MASKRQSATEPVQDTAELAQATIREEEFEAKSSLQEENNIPTLSRELEISFILQGIQAQRDTMLKTAQAKLNAIQQELSEQLAQLDEFLKNYAQIYANLKEVKTDNE